MKRARRCGIARPIAKAPVLACMLAVLASASCGSSSGDLAIGSIEPSEGSARGGEVIIVHGHGFEGSVSVSFGDAPARSVKRVSSERLEVETPRHLAESVAVKVTADGNTMARARAFTFLPLQLSFREAPSWYLPAIDGLPVSDAVAADFDGDGHTDLLVASRNAGSILMRNSGKGSFAGAELTAPVDPPDAGKADAQVADAQAADASSDEAGAADAEAGPVDAQAPDAATHADAGAPPSKPPVWLNTTHRVLVADFNDDDAPDLFVCNQGRQPSRIFLNDGTGAFDEVPGAIPEDADECRDAVIGDLDGDGLDDIAMIGSGGAGLGKSYLRVLLRKAGATPAFSPISALEPDASAMEAACGTVAAPADVTASASLTSSDTAYGAGACALSFDAAGTAEPVTLWFALPELPAIPSDVLVELRQQAASAKVQVRLRDARGEQFFYDAGAIGGTWSHVQAKKPESWASEGADADGVIDLPVAAVGISVLPTSSASKGTLSIDSLKLIVPEVGAVIVDDFERKEFAHAWAQRMVSIVAGDLDDDGDADLLLSSDDGTGPALVLLRNDGAVADTPVALREMVSGAFDALVDPIAATALLDLDGDGDLDIVAGATEGQDRLLSNDGNAHFFDDTLAAMPVDRVSARALALTDLDMDGRLDLLIANDGAANRLYVNRAGRGFLDATPAMPLRQDHTLRLLSLDADGDGDTDLFVLNLQGEPPALLVSVESPERGGN